MKASEAAHRAARLLTKCRHPTQRFLEIAAELLALEAERIQAEKRALERRGATEYTGMPRRDTQAKYERLGGVLCDSIV